MARADFVTAAWLLREEGKRPADSARRSATLLGPGDLVTGTTFTALGVDLVNGLTRMCAKALVIGGVLLILINVILTPLLPTQRGEAVMITSTVYLFRLSASGVAAMLLLLGCLGVHLGQRSASGAFGTVAFLVAFVGNSLLVAVEWSNVFVLRAVAQANPEALSTLDKSALMTTGFASAAGLFALGWFLLAVSLWRTRVLGRWVPLTVVAGLILIPALGATPLDMAGSIVGNVVFGLGLIGLGRSLAKVGC